MNITFVRIRLVSVKISNRKNIELLVSVKFTKDVVIILLSISFTVEFMIHFYQMNL